MTPQHDDRRRHTRYPFTAEVKMAVLVPDQTFTPMDIGGHVIDLSTGGLRIKSRDISKQLYLDLLKDLHYAKIEVDFPGFSDPFQAKTSIVWLDFHDPTTSERAYCLVGLRFELFYGRSEALLQRVIKEQTSL